MVNGLVLPALSAVKMDDGIAPKRSKYLDIKKKLTDQYYSC